MSKRGAKLYLGDIKVSIGRIEKYTRGSTFNEFANNTQKIDAVVRNLSIIGEAVKNIPKEIKSKYHDVPWREIMGMRNKVVHEYFDVDEDILWKTIKEDMPIFKKQISKLFKKY